MIQPHTSTKAMQKIDTCEVLAFRTDTIRGLVTGIDGLISSNEMSDRLDFSDQSLYIPRFQMLSLLEPIIGMFGDFVRDAELVTPMLTNFMRTEVMDPEATAGAGTLTQGSVEELLSAYILLIREMLALYEHTHDRYDGQYSFELLRVTSTGALILCRFRLDC